MKRSSEDSEKMRKIKELFELHIDGTIDTLEELAERWSELLDRPVYIESWSDFIGHPTGDDSYVGFYTKTVGKKKPKQRPVRFIHFIGRDAILLARLQKKQKQEEKERRAQRKRDRARDASYCLTCRQPVRSKK